MNNDTRPTGGDDSVRATCDEARGDDGDAGTGGGDAGDDGGDDDDGDDDGGEARGDGGDDGGEASGGSMAWTGGGDDGGHDSDEPAPKRRKKIKRKGRKARRIDAAKVR